MSLHFVNMLCHALIVSALFLLFAEEVNATLFYLKITGYQTSWFAPNGNCLVDALRVVYLKLDDCVRGSGGMTYSKWQISGNFLYENYYTDDQCTNAYDEEWTRKRAEFNGLSNVLYGSTIACGTNLLGDYGNIFNNVVFMQDMSANGIVMNRFKVEAIQHPSTGFLTFDGSELMSNDGINIETSYFSYEYCSNRMTLPDQVSIIRNNYCYFESELYEMYSLVGSQVTKNEWRNCMGCSGSAANSWSTCYNTLHSTYDIESCSNEPQFSRTGMEMGFRVIRIEGGPPTISPTPTPTPNPTPAPDLTPVKFRITFKNLDTVCPVGNNVIDPYSNSIAGIITKHGKYQLTYLNVIQTKCDLTYSTPPGIVFEYELQYESTTFRKLTVSSSSNSALTNENLQLASSSGNEVDEPLKSKLDMLDYFLDTVSSGLYYNYLLSNYYYDIPGISSATVSAEPIARDGNGDGNGESNESSTDTDGKNVTGLISGIVGGILVVMYAAYRRYRANNDQKVNEDASMSVVELPNTSHGNETSTDKQYLSRVAPQPQEHQYHDGGGYFPVPSPQQQPQPPYGSQFVSSAPSLPVASAVLAYNNYGYPQASQFHPNQPVPTYIASGGGNSLLYTPQFPTYPSTYDANNMQQYGQLPQQQQYGQQQQYVQQQQQQYGQQQQQYCQQQQQYGQLQQQVGGPQPY